MMVVGTFNAILMFLVIAFDDTECFLAACLSERQVWATSHRFSIGDSFRSPTVACFTNFLAARTWIGVRPTFSMRDNGFPNSFVTPMVRPACPACDDKKRLKTVTAYNELAGLNYFLGGCAQSTHLWFLR